MSELIWNRKSVKYCPNPLGLGWDILHLRCVAANG